MDETIDEVLESFDELDGLNYVVSLAIYRISGAPARTPKALIVAALGERTVVTEVVPASGATLIAEVERCLRYRGSRGGCEPNSEFQRSPRFAHLLVRLRAYLEAAVADASVWAFTLSHASHPFYPVMWVFGYLIVRPEGAEVFIGASSD